MNPSYVDEEDLLGFHVFVAELELLTGGRRDGPFDEVALLELLQKLLISVDPVDVARVKQYQRRCEQSLVSLLSRGSCPEVQQLVAATLSKLYAVGDRLPLFSQVNALQGILLSRDAFGKKLPENVKVGMLDCVRVLCQNHGSHLHASLPSLISVGAKHANKAAGSRSVTLAASHLVAGALVAMGEDPRQAVTSQAEALKLAERHIKSGKCETIRVAGLEIVRAVGRSGAAALWIQGGAPYDEMFKLIVQTLTDPSFAVRNAASRALGELVAVLKSTALQAAIEKESRENKKQSLTRLASRSFPDALGPLLCESAILNKRCVCVALAKAWVAYLAALRDPDESTLVQYSVDLVGVLSNLPTLQPDLKGRDSLDLSVEVGHSLSTGEFPLVQACVLYALRIGVFRSLSESGQRKLLDQLSALVCSPSGKCVPVAVCSLEGIRVLLSFLGEVSPETASDLGITFMEKLVSNSAAVRSQAAAALGSLVRADQACAATLITSCLEFLKNQVEQLTSLSARFGAMHPLPDNLLLQVPEIYALPEDAVKKSQDSRIRDAMHAVYGYATGLAALLVSASRTSLNVPSKLFDGAFECARKLIQEPQSTVVNSWSIEMKAGYCILGGLCVAMPLALLQSKGDILELWEPALGSTAQAVLLNKGLLKTGKEMDLAMQLWWRSEALLALEVYLRAVVEHRSFRKKKTEMQRIVQLLTPLLEGLMSSGELEDVRHAAGGAGGWVAGTLGYLQLRLLGILDSLPETLMDSHLYPLLVKLCSQPFSPSSSLLNALTTAASVVSVLLREVLDSGDAHLGPWEVEEEPLEEKLSQMSGEKGAPHYASWECGMPVWGISALHGSGPGESLTFDPVPFPQYTSLAVGLVRYQVRVFGKLLRSVGLRNRLKLLESLLSCIQGVRGIKNPVLQEALLCCVCCAVLKGCDRSRSHHSTEAAKKVMELSMAVMESGVRNARIFRGAAEMSTVAAHLADDAFSLRLAKQFCSDLATAPSPDRQRFLLLALGSLFRSKGGMCLQTLLPHITSLIFGYLNKASGEVVLWALHSLYLIAASAGLTFMRYIQPSLELAQKLMTKHGDVTALRPYLGRLSNAMVALLGPELLPGSQSYIICKCLMRQMQLTGLEVSGALEVVLYTQQLILFAPQAVPATKNVAILMESLTLPHPSLRYTSAVTLRHLTERDPQAVCREGIEKALFSALDNESEGHIACALHRTLEALQFAQCPTRPSVWLAVTSVTVMMQSREGPQRRGMRTEGSLMIEDEGEMEQDPSPSSPQETGRTPRLKTRLFACQCLLKIFEAVGKDPLHFDLVQAKQSASDQEYLVCQLQEIVRLGFSLSTGQVEALQPEGIKLLNAVILHFGEAEDPDVEGAKLLFQFQAQFMSPLRQALAPVAPPLLFMSGSILAVAFLRSGLGGNDAAVLKQLVGLLVEPILTWSQLRYRNFSEWVSACVRVSLLEAHAHCTVLAETRQDPLCSEIVANAQKPILDQLKTLWLGLLTDYMVLNRWRQELWTAYQPRVLCIGVHAVDAAEKISLEEAWPVILRALALHVPSAAEISASLQEPPSQTPDEVISAAELYGRLLDITTVRLGTSSMKVIEQAKSEDGLQSTALSIEPVCICVRVLRALLGADYLALELCPAQICLEIIEMIMSIIQQVIHPIVCALQAEGAQAQEQLLSVVLSGSELLLGIASGLTLSYMEHPSFIPALLDCVLCCSSILAPSAGGRPRTHAVPTASGELERGRENCLRCAQKVLSAAPWDGAKSWLGTFLRHALQILDQEHLTEGVLHSACELLRSVGSMIIDRDEDLTNGQETVSSGDLTTWSICSLMELIKKDSGILEALPGPAPTLQLRMSQLLTTVLALLSRMPSGDAEAAALLTEVSTFLSESLESTRPSEVQLAVLKSLKLLIQESASDGTSTALSALCITALGPVVASLAHEKLSLRASSPEQLAVVADSLKYLILTLGLAEVEGKEGLIFQVLLPLLVEAMEAEGAASLRQVALKLVTHLNGGKHGPSFKAAVGGLSTELRGRFQKGLQAAVGVEAQRKDPAAPCAATQKPSIVLKNFSAQ